MSEVAALIKQVNLAAKKVITRIQEIDREIAQLDSERGGIVDAPLSKCDLMEYVREDIKRRGAYFPNLLRTKWARAGRHTNFPNHERFFNDGGVQPIPYLNGEVPTYGIAFRPDVFYWYFGDLIEARFEKALDSIEWPESGHPLKERRIKIHEIDAKIEALTEERDQLAGELTEAMPEN